MAKNTKGQLARLTPNAIKTVIGGQEIHIPSNRDENDALNMVLSAQMRALIQEQLQKYKDKDIALTPKELRDLVESAKAIGGFSREVYLNLGDPPMRPNAPAPKNDAAVDDLDFSKAIPVTPKKDDRQPESP